MARPFRRSVLRRLLDALVRACLTIGIGPRRTYLMTVRGRTTGRPRTTPVTLVESPRGRWLVAPYGEVGWVRNVRAAGRVTLRRGRRAETVDVIEVGTAESAPVLKQYAREVPITRPYFEARPDDPVDAFRREAARHPVFRLAPAPPARGS